MKIFLIITGISVVMCLCDTDAKHPAITNTSLSSANPDSVSFSTQVMPLLRQKCSPCHFTGGKMYERMPFDKSITILSHQAGILGRIKDQPEMALIKRYIFQLNKGN